jgi:hypothetical protein
MCAAKKSRSSQALNSAFDPKRRELLQIILAVLLFPLAVFFSLVSDVNLDLFWVLLFFAVGALVGIVGQFYWIRVLIHNAHFYADYNQIKPHKPHEKLFGGRLRTHSLNLLPFYIFGFFVFIVLWFVLGTLGLDFAYAIPFALGALEGIPIAYWVTDKRS